MLKPIAESEAPFYVRIPVLDKPGVLASISNQLSQEGISIESLIQREQAVRSMSDAQWVPVVLLTQRVQAGALQRALDTIAEQPEVVGDIVHVRVETLAEH